MWIAVFPHSILVATLHIKIGHAFNLELKRLAKVRSSTVSELIRQALVVCYQIELIGLPDKTSFGGLSRGFHQSWQIKRIYGTYCARNERMVKRTSHSAE